MPHVGAKSSPAVTQPCSVSQLSMPARDWGLMQDLGSQVAPAAVNLELHAVEIEGYGPFR